MFKTASKQTLLCALSVSWAALGFAATANSSLTSAQSTGPTPENWNQVTQYNVDGKLQPKTAVHGGKNGFVVDGSFLYWKAEVDNLDYAVSTSQTIDPTTAQITEKTKIKELGFDWGAGGRFGIGYIFGNMESWKLSLTGTHLATHAHGSTTTPSLEPEFGSLQPTWTSVLMGEYLSTASGKWHLNFNTVNLDLGRDFFISKYITMSPYFGLQAAWIDQKYKLNYNGFWAGTDSTGAPIFFSRNNSLDMRNQFRGGGLHFGSDFIFHFVKNFGLTGSLSGSVIYGYNSLRTEGDGGLPVNVGAPAPILFPVDFTTTDRKHRIRTSLETELGFIWEQYWNCDRSRFALSATYGFSVWFDQNFFINQSAAPNEANLSPNVLDSSYALITKSYGDLEMQGLIIKAEFDF